MPSRPLSKTSSKSARINAKFFSNADLPKLQEHLVNQICEATGGPCKYTGRSMKEAHTGMGVDEASFGALVEDLKKSLAKFNVPQAEQDELIGALAKMHDDIVEKP
jgi:hemoglobin